MRRLCLIVTLALIAVACGGSDNEQTTGTTTTTTTEPAATTTAAESDDEAAADPTELADEPNTASFRGVTEDTIKVGVVAFDWDRLSALGVKLGRSNSDDLAIAGLEAINERGGVHGRMLEIIPIVFLPVGNVESDAACVELTEDEEVFVVIGVLLGDSVLCYTEAHSTAVIMASGMTAERAERARAPYVTIVGAAEERARRFVAAMEETGVLEGANVGVTGSLDVSEIAYLGTIAALTEAGYDTHGGLLGANEDDFAETARQQEVIYERFDEAGVNTAVSTSGVPLEIANASNAGYAPGHWLFTTIMTDRGLVDAGVDPFYIDGAYGVVNTPTGTSLQPGLGDDPLIGPCVADLEERVGRELPYSLEPAINDLISAFYVCSMAEILERGLTNAGPVLTNDSFQTGLEQIGEIALPGFTEASLSPGHMGVADGLTTVQFDAAEGVWAPIS